MLCLVQKQRSSSAATGFSQLTLSARCHFIIFDSFYPFLFLRIHFRVIIFVFLFCYLIKLLELLNYLCQH